MPNQIDFKNEHSNSLDLFHRLARIHSHHLQQLLPAIDIYSPQPSKFTYGQAVFEFEMDKHLNHTSSPVLPSLPLAMASHPLQLPTDSFAVGLLSQNHFELINRANKDYPTDLALRQTKLKNEPLNLSSPFPMHSHNFKPSSPNK
ncbi:MAG: hypothetical protein WC595_01585 [Candidatus Nanoarchaeia archaeon]